VKCKKHLNCAQAATRKRNWVVAFSEWTSCGDVIQLSEGEFDRDDWLWLTGCHALVWANLCAFHSMNFGLALRAAIEAWKAHHELQNVREEHDFESYVLPTLWKMMYLWASTSDCEEETLDLDVKALLLDALRRSGDLDVKEFLIDALSHSGDVGELKSQCKFVIKKSESVIWELQKYFFHYSKTGECLGWVSEGINFYKKDYPDKMDYVSKFNEASIYFMLGACENTIRILEEIRDNLESKPWEENATNVHPAARYCTLQYAFLIHQMLCMCYEVMILQPGERRRPLKMIDDAKKEREVCKSLWAQMQSDGILLPSRKRLAEVWEHTMNKRYEV
jgi:hypothetical protein